MNKAEQIRSLDEKVENLSSKIDEVNDKIIDLIEIIRNQKLDEINRQTTYTKKSSGLID